MNQLVSVVVVDDHPFFRDGVTRGLVASGRISVVGEAADGRAALEVIAGADPDVAVVDYQMPQMDGIELTQALVRNGLRTKVLLLSAITDSPVVYQALQAGAGGYLSKESSRDDLVAAVMQIAGGKTVVPPELAAALVGEIQANAATSGPMLTERESQVLKGFSRGQSIPQIASELFIGASTVKTHAQNLYQKLGVSDRAAAVAEGMRRRLIE